VEERKKGKGKRENGRRIVQELHLEQVIKNNFSTLLYLWQQ
jgi:hypothetical protein